MYGRVRREGESRQASPAQQILLAHHHMCSSRLLVYNFTPNKGRQAFGLTAIGQHNTHHTIKRIVSNLSIDSFDGLPAICQIFTDLRRRRWSRLQVRREEPWTARLPSYELTSLWTTSQGQRLIFVHTLTHILSHTRPCAVLNTHTICGAQLPTRMIARYYEVMSWVPW